LAVAIILILTFVAIASVMLLMSAKTTEEVEVTLIKPEPAKHYELGEFIVNLADEGDGRYIKVAITMAYPRQNLELEKEIKDRKAQFKDMVINILADRQSAEINDSQGKARLKEELMDMMNNVLREGAIVQLFFTDFAIQ
jgi:flagellar FliL protein